MPTCNSSRPAARTPTVQRGGPTAGDRSIPIYIDQNPFFNAQNRSLVTQLVADGLTLPTIAGQNAPGTTTPARVLYLSRALVDVQGATDSANLVDTYRSSTAIEGDFTAFDRDFYWETSFVYGKTNITNLAEQILDIEFALATDVVTGPNGNPVCRQQTLAAPEPISIRNPQLASINTTLSLTPTAAQVANCRPLNLFGDGAASPEAAAYVVADAGSSNISEQYYANASFGGEIIELPAGPFSFGAQFEYRREELLFTPSENFRTGAARNTAGQGTAGGLRFIEGGFEGNVPVFGKGFNFFGMNTLTLEGAVRVVSRNQFTSNTAFAQAPGTLDVTFQGGGIWRPFEDLAFRGNRTRSVRSASIVELFGAPQTGFGGQVHPCSTTAISQGPNPTVRRANCISAVQSLGIAASAAEAETFLATFIPVGGNRPAATGGNPFLSNEQADLWSVGVTYEPSFIPNLSMSLDFNAIDLAGQVGLVGPDVTMPNCFDDTAFPDSQINGTPICDQFVFGVPGPGGSFVTPSVNPLTGRPIPAAAVAGQSAQVQAPFEAAFIQFPNLNLGATEYRSMTGSIQYSFDLDDVLGSRAADWGSIRLAGSITYLRRFDTSGTGTFSDVNPAAGEPGNEKYQSVFSLQYRVQRLTSSLQWFRDSASVGNVLTAENLFPEQSPAFFTPSTNFFNLNFQYDITENLTSRLIVNNLTDSQAPLPEFGIVNDPRGRRYVATLQYTF